MENRASCLRAAVRYDLGVVILMDEQQMIQNEPNDLSMSKDECAELKRKLFPNLTWEEIAGQWCSSM